MCAVYAAAKPHGKATTLGKVTFRQGHPEPVAGFAWCGPAHVGEEYIVGDRDCERVPRAAVIAAWRRVEGFARVCDRVHATVAAQREAIDALRDTEAQLSGAPERLLQAFDRADEALAAAIKLRSVATAFTTHLTVLHIVERAGCLPCFYNSDTRNASWQSIPEAVWVTTLYSPSGSQHVTWRSRPKSLPAPVPDILFRLIQYDFTKPVKQLSARIAHLELISSSIILDERFTYIRYCLLQLS
jgi:hypothetical protein